MHHFNLLHPTLTFQNSAFEGGFKVIQIVSLESTAWDKVREAKF